MERQIGINKAGNKTQYKIRDQTFSRQKIIFSLIGISVAIIAIDFNAVAGYQYQFLLPFAYAITYFLFAPPIKELGMGYAMLNGVWIFRYIINPLVIKSSGYGIRYNSIASDGNLNFAVLLMVLELSIAIISCGIFYKILKKPDKDNRDKVKIKNVNFSVILILMALTAMIIVFDTNAIFGFDFILNNEFARRADTKFGISISVLIWFKTIATIGLITKFGKREEKKESIWNLIFAFFIMILSMSFFSGTGRNGLLIEALAYIYVLSKFFPKHRKKIFILSFSGIFVILMTITMYRFYGTRNLTDSFGIFNIHVLSDMFNQYFGGQNNVGIGIRSISMYGDQYNLSTLMRDSFVNTTIINKFVTDIPGTVEIFNSTLYGHTWWADQISPMITQLLGLFNVFGILLIPFISYIIIKMDRIAESSRYSLGIFLATYIGVKVAFFSPGNFTILMTALTNEFIPMYILFKVSLIKLTAKKPARI